METVTYFKFCEHYELDPDAEESKSDYEEYLNKSSFFNLISNKNKDVE